MDPDAPTGAMLLVVTDDHELLLHLRDDVPGIAWPGCWAGFGGAVEPGETAEQAVRREVEEETGIVVDDPVPFAELADEEGDGRIVTFFYVVGSISPSDIDLREGAGFGVHPAESIDALAMPPFVRRAIRAHLLPLLESS
ncbi:MAG: NUDIX domain-containing protein [Actinomycetota bacterium]|nr:NUDIX domain-containing protein [Actinomycetota bacterium]